MTFLKKLVFFKSPMPAGYIPLCCICSLEPGTICSVTRNNMNKDWKQKCYHRKEQPNEYMLEIKNMKKISSLFPFMKIMSSNTMLFTTCQNCLKWGIVMMDSNSAVFWFHNSMCFFMHQGTKNKGGYFDMTIIIYWKICRWWLKLFLILNDYNETGWSFGGLISLWANNGGFINIDKTIVDIRWNYR